MKLPQFMILALLIAVGPHLFAQSKKQLKEEVAQLKVENAELSRESEDFERQLQQSRDAYNQVLEQSTQLQSQVQQLQEQLANLNRDYQKLNADYEALKPGSVGGSSGGGSLPNNTGGTKPCIFYAGQMAVGSSYTLDYELWPGGGWGIQIASYSDLCTAETKAREFTKDYSLYPTYIKAKNVNGKSMFSIIYGAIESESKARTYHSNFKKIAKGSYKNGFLVQH